MKSKLLSILVLFLLAGCNQRTFIYPDIGWSIYNYDIEEFDRLYQQVPIYRNKYIKRMIKKRGTITDTLRLNQKKLSGTTVLQVFIDTTGLPETILLIKPLNRTYDSLAIDALRRTQFRPLRINKKFTKYSLIVSYNFFEGQALPPYINGISTASGDFPAPIHNIKKDIYEIYEVSEPPILISKIVPHMPESRKPGFFRYADSFLFQIVVDEQGKVIDVQTEKSTDERIEERLVRSIKSSRYKPAILDGQPVKVRFSIPYRMVYKVEIERIYIWRDINHPF